MDGIDLKYDYSMALKRQNFNQSQVDALRDAVAKHDVVPKSLTDKQVNICNKIIKQIIFKHKLFFAAAFIPRQIKRGHREGGKCDD